MLNMLQTAVNRTSYAISIIMVAGLVWVSYGSNFHLAYHASFGNDEAALMDHQHVDATASSALLPIVPSRKPPNHK